MECGLFSGKYFLLKINKVNVTTTLTLNEDLGKCSCDLTQNNCDYLCCCDTDCSSDTLSQWANTTDACSNMGKIILI